MPNPIESKLGFMNCNMSLTAEALTFLSKKTKGLTYYDILLIIHRSPTTTVIDVVCISGWYVDGCYHRNPLYLHAKPSPTASGATSLSGTQNHA